MHRQVSIAFDSKHSLVEWWGDFVHLQGSSFALQRHWVLPHITIVLQSTTDITGRLPKQHWLNMTSTYVDPSGSPWQVWPAELRVAVKERAALELAKRSLVVSRGAKHSRIFCTILFAFKVRLEASWSYILTQSYTYNHTYVHVHVQSPTITYNHTHIVAYTYIRHMFLIKSVLSEVMGHKNLHR